MAEGHVNNLTGNPAVLKRINTVRVMNHLRLKGPSSRVKLTQATGLDAKTITNISNSLIENGLVICLDASRGKKSRGRPAETLSINPEAAFAVGLDIGASQVTSVLTDLQGRIVSKCRHEFGSAKSANYLFKEAQSALDDVLGSLPKNRKKRLKGIGVCVPGFIDRHTGMVLRSVNIRGFRNFPLVRLLQERFATTLILEKSSRAMAMAEIWYGNNTSANFICVDLGYGIGMGIVSNGLIYRGANEISGEIGHTRVVQKNGLKCSCGKRGCLETVASGKALAKQAERTPLRKYNIKSKGAKAIHGAALAGNAQAKKLLETTGYYTGIAIANVINLFDPTRVIVNGGLINAGPFLLDSLEKTVRENYIGHLGGNCQIEISKLGKFSGALGAAMLPLRRYFEFENIRL